MGLLEELEAARARTAQLERQVAAATCAEVGHRWRQLGGRSCDCEPNPYCSFPVYQCTVCGDCDYGDNIEADHIRAECEKDPAP